MIVEELLALPAYITIEGVNFELQLFSNGAKEMRLGYIIQHVDAGSPHRDAFEEFGSWLNIIVNRNNPPLQGFLKLYERIETDVDLIWAIRDLWFWCQKNGFIDNNAIGLLINY